MNPEQTRQLSRIFHLMAEELDVPKGLQKEATAKYEHLGEFSRRYAHTHFLSDSRMYVQGSFALGTPIRPVRDGDEYDVDLVFERDVSKASVTREDLKKQVGEMLHHYADDCSARGRDVPRVKEKTRCWTLDYEGLFHMDVLPALPHEIPPTSFPDRIWITDRDYSRWRESDPLGYRAWFRTQMEAAFRKRRVAMAADADVEVEEVPEYLVRTPLQRVVQILKRHRDLRYSGPRDYKPASIIITTLAAQAHGQGGELASAVIRAAKSMRHFSRPGAKHEILNPVNDGENFADRWDDPEYPKAFQAWANMLSGDLALLTANDGLDAVLDGMKTGWGRGPATRAGERYGDEMLSLRRSGSLRMASGGLLGTSGATQVRDHEFHGEIPPTSPD